MVIWESSFKFWNVQFYNLPSRHLWYPPTIPAVSSHQFTAGPMFLLIWNQIFLGGKCINLLLCDVKPSFVQLLSAYQQSFHSEKQKIIIIGEFAWVQQLPGFLNNLFFATWDHFFELIFEFACDHLLLTRLVIVLSGDGLSALFAVL